MFITLHVKQNTAKTYLSHFDYSNVVRWTASLLYSLNTDIVSTNC